jgi:acetylornithine/succinyldiaminopimelate/putrescine aminotransferase
MIRGEAGALVADADFITAVYHKCKQTGTLFVVDEIQSGFHRTGPFMAFMHHKLVPDILVLGKAIGGGMPMGAFVASREMMNSFASNPVLGHITTFGGHPVCCAAAMASLQVVTQVGQSEVERKGRLFKELLKHPAILSVSGKGLMMGLEFASEKLAKEVIAKCIEKGVFTDWFLFAPHRIRIAPPLIINDDEIRHACNIIMDSIEQVVH